MDTNQEKSMGKRRDGEREQFWRDAIARRTESGLTIREFCRQEDLAVSTYQFWRGELLRRGTAATTTAPKRKKPSPPAFVPVSINDRFSLVIEVVLANGTIVRVPSGADAATLQSVLGVLGPASC